MGTLKERFPRPTRDGHITTSHDPGNFAVCILLRNVQKTGVGAQFISGDGLFGIVVGGWAAGIGRVGRHGTTAPLSGFASFSNQS